MSARWRQLWRGKNVGRGVGFTWGSSLQYNQNNESPKCRTCVCKSCKLSDYVLDSGHRVGKHKARFFAATLGMRQTDAEALRLILLRVVQTSEANLGQLDEHGQRYQVDFMLNWQGRQALIRSAWIVRTDEDFTRFVSCYPLRG